MDETDRIWPLGFVTEYGEFMRVEPYSSSTFARWASTVPPDGRYGLFVSVRLRKDPIPVYVVDFNRAVAVQFGPPHVRWILDEHTLKTYDDFDVAVAATIMQCSFELRTLTGVRHGLRMPD
jgi:hypothetical protein